MTTLTLTEFLLARIAEDVWTAEDCWGGGDDGPGTWLGWIKAECEAKRRIVERYNDTLARIDDDGWPTAIALEQVREYEEFVLPALAAVYADHPDYREWRA